MRRLLIFVLVATVSTGAGAGPAQDHTLAAASDLPAFIERLDRLRVDARIPGLSVAVVRDQALVFALGLGEADVGQRIAATAQTAYDIASVAKPLSAVVALRLAQEGKLDLDRPMAQYSQWAEFCAEFSQQPTVFAHDLRCRPPTHALRHLLSHTATGTPGSRFAYNPVLYSWASRPMRSVADAPFSTLVEQYVFAPAGMTGSARKHRDLPLRSDVAKRLAPAYHLTASGEVELTPASAPQGDGAAGGVVTTVLDLARFDIALDQGALIADTSREAMMTPARTQEGRPLPYALGWFVQDYRGHRLVWHSGWWENGYSALYLKVPEKRLSFIILANAEGVWKGNPQSTAEVQSSAFARAFLQAFVQD